MQNFRMAFLLFNTKTYGTSWVAGAFWLRTMIAKKMKTFRMAFLLWSMKTCVKCRIISAICLLTMTMNSIWMSFLFANMKTYCEVVGYQCHMSDVYACDMDEDVHCNQ